MRIVIDMQGAQTESRFRGIGRYTLSLSQAIAKNRGEHEIILALNGLFPETIEPIRANFDGLLPQENIRIWKAPGPTFEADPENATRSRVAELLREAFFQSLAADCVLVSSLFEGLGDSAVTSVGLLGHNILTAVVLYDLIPLLSPDEHFRNSRLHQEFYGRKIKSLERSHCLLAISESASQEALQALKFSEEQVINISGAYDESFKILNLSSDDYKSIYERVGISRPFVMYTGGADERKNLHFLIKAYAELPDSLRGSHQLVLAGKMPFLVVESFKKTAKSVGLKSEDVIFTGYVSDNDLVALYNTCKVFIFPSLHEGFGLPPLEAMACGAPTISADATSLPEVIGFSGALFDPTSVESISEKLQQALVDDDFRSKLVEHAKKQVRRFSWEASAKKALWAMENLERFHKKTEEDLPSMEAFNAHLIKILVEIPLTLGELSSIAQCIADNEQRIGLPQLMLDVSTIVHNDAKSGIQRVVRSILQELVKQSNIEYIVRPVYLEGNRYRYADQLLPEKTIKDGEELNALVSFDAGDIYLSLDLNMHLVPLMHPLHEEMRRRGVRMNYIVYDLLLATNPEWWRPPNPELFNSWLKSICAVGDNLICISNAVADEMKSWLERNPITRLRGAPNIQSFHLGADIENSKPSLGLPAETESVLAALEQRPTFLMVGTLEPRKGHAQTLAAFEILWGAGNEINLVIVGKPGWMVERLVVQLRTHQESGNRLFWLEGISDEYLEKIYSASTCLIAASYGEGFGLPLIEAAQHKLPIIARDIPVFREVAGENAQYFSGRTPEALAESIHSWLQAYKNGQHLGSHKMRWITWKESAEKLREILFLPPGMLDKSVH